MIVELQVTKLLTTFLAESHWRYIFAILG